MLLVRGKLRVIALASVGLMAALCTATTTTYAHDSIVFIVFDVPGAKFTSPVSINDRGEIVGWWSSVGYLDQPHGFVRDRCGTITSFDVPGATATDVLFPQSINREGDSVGIWSGPSGFPGSFLRRRDGTITSLLVPGAATPGVGCPVMWPTVAGPRRRAAHSRSGRVARSIGVSDRPCRRGIRAGGREDLRRGQPGRGRVRHHLVLLLRRDR